MDTSQPRLFPNPLKIAGKDPSTSEESSCQEIASFSNVKCVFYDRNIPFETNKL